MLFADISHDVDSTETKNNFDNKENVGSSDVTHNNLNGRFISF